MNESLGRRLLRSAAHFSAGQMVSMLASIVRIAISARVLSKETTGLWLGMQLVLSYGGSLHLGALLGLFRSVPMLRAKNDSAAARLEEQTSFAFVCGVSALSAAPLWWITHRVCPNAAPRQVAGVVALVVIGLFRAYFNTVIKAYSRFKDLAVGLAWGSAAAVLTLPLIVVFGLDGLIVSTGAQALVEIAILAGRLPPPGLGFSPAVLSSQIRVGALTLLTSLALLLLTTIDRTVMLERLGTEATGNYYIGANVMVLMPIVVAMPAAVLSPQFFERVGRNEDVQPLVERPVRLAALGFAALIGVGAAAIGPVCALFWPKLTGGSSAAQAALFATYPLVLAGLVSNVYYAHNRQGLHLVILVATAGMSFLLAHAGVSLTKTVTGAAAGAAIGLYLYFPASCCGAFFVLGNVRAGIRLVGTTLPPIVYAAVVSIASQLASSHIHGSTLTQGAIATVLTSLLVSPLLWRARTLLRDGLAASAPKA